MSPLPPRQTPLLIYDGDCSFCKCCVKHWKRITGSRVSFAPYQEIACHFPEIPPASFQAAVQFIDSEGTVWSGAEAVFRSLASVPEKRWLLGCYLRIPGFASVSEFAYRFIARRRGFLCRVTGLFQECPRNEPPK